jgi:Gpi18-like mannosyltransferase
MLNSFVRSNNNLLLTIPGIIYLNKLLMALTAKNVSLTNIVKIILQGISVAVIVISPLIIVLKHPWDIYCDNTKRISRPSWCDNTIPNVYSYIQYAHWNVQFMGWIMKE